MTDPADQQSQSNSSNLLGRLFETNSGLSFWETMAITAFTIGTLTIMSFAFPLNEGWWARSATIFAVAMGAWMTGGALGFLFGVPRYKSAPDTQPNSLSNSTVVQEVLAFTPNSNLEQISDWLTKIIVGATLVQVGHIQALLVQLCEWTAAKVNRPEAGLFCGGMVVFFFFSGFLWGYLWCSLRIFREMAKLTKQIREGD